MPIEPPMTSVAITTLGSFEVLLAGAPLRFTGKTPHKPLDLLKGLLVAGGRGVSRRSLSDALWPDLESWLARQALNSAVFRLRSILRCKSAVRMDGEQLRLDPLQCRVDAWDFEQAFARAVGTDALYDVLMSYRGSFLGDCEHPLAFDARDRLRRKFVRGVLQLGDIYQRRAELDAAILLYQHALDVEGTAEEIFQALIACLGRRGEVAAVAAAYQRCRQVLDRHFGALPSALTERLYSKVSSRACIEAQPQV
jgi:DNA-binding SARP family transcriptional activator